jgi:hypothetical protein
MIAFAPAVILKNYRSALLRCVKTFRDPLASSPESAMGFVWGRQRDDPKSNMATALQR